MSRSDNLTAVRAQANVYGDEDGHYACPRKVQEECRRRNICAGPVGACEHRRSGRLAVRRGRYGMRN